MPNHCYNILRLAENPHRLEEVLRPFLSHPHPNERQLDLEKILPMPPGILATCQPNPSESQSTWSEREEENLKNHGHRDWHSWACGNWGTKWNTYDNNFTETSVSFSSAWSPPIGALAELAKITKEAWILEYLEEGCDFIGRTHLTPDGIDDACYTLEEAPEELKDSLGYTSPEDFEEIFPPPPTALTSTPTPPSPSTLTPNSPSCFPNL